MKRLLLILLLPLSIAASTGAFLLVGNMFSMLPNIFKFIGWGIPAGIALLVYGGIVSLSASIAADLDFANDTEGNTTAREFLAKVIPIASLLFGLIIAIAIGCS